MHDVIVIGGGVIGACTAWQLAERGAEVLLLERGALAGGATRRSQGLLLEPEVDVMRPLFEETCRLYEELEERSGIDFALDAEPIGTLFWRPMPTSSTRWPRSRFRPAASCSIERRFSRSSPSWLRPSSAACCFPAGAVPSPPR